MTKAHHFFAGLLYGAGAYIVIDYLAFHYYDVPAAAERILRGMDDAGS